MKKKWWHEKIGYQIYLKSFLDTNGDGVGDLAGVIEKLPYLEQLGVDILWLFPVYPSPMVDNGYDISDYENIDPRFGTLEDMDRLIAEAKRKTSRSSWILWSIIAPISMPGSRKQLQIPRSLWRLFLPERGKDGKEPNNWRSYFGGSVWEKAARTGEFILLPCLCQRAAGFKLGKSCPARGNLQDGQLVA